MNERAAFITHGRKYHVDPNCYLMRNGEDLHDFDGADEYDSGFTAGSYRSEVSHPEIAAARGKLPCLYCVPVEQRCFPPLYGQNFGHQPVNPYEGTEFNVEALTCARCATWTNWPEVGLVAGVSVSWPCKSAAILGLAGPRKELLP